MAAGRRVADCRARKDTGEVEALRRTIRAAGEMGIRIVTIFPSVLKTGRGQRAKSASSWDFSVASCEMIWPNYTKAMSACA